MMKNILKLILFLFVTFGFLSCAEINKVPQPNILLIYADDLGYGDISAYNSSSKIPTPNMDKLANEGMLFLDAHAPAAICAPSRYSLLTGRYAWREPLGTELGHAYAQCKIELNRPTIGSILKSNGYNTAQIGKWGLRHDYREALKDKNLHIDSITPKAFDYSKPIYGANTRGFDYAFTLLMLAGKEGNKYSKNDKWFFENGYPYQGTTPHPENFDWFACLPTITNKAIEYIQAYSGSREDSSFRIIRDKPFFMYFDPHVPHLPIVPNMEFIGTSNAGDYGDFVSELDNSIGRILDTLEAYGLMENTIIILSSDNGPERLAYERIRQYDHYSMGNLRGVKRDIWEGGHRVPLIIKWKGFVNEGSSSSEPVGLIDMMVTLCSITGTEVPQGAGEDSFDFSKVLLGKEFKSPIREPLIYHSSDKRFAIRDLNWVMIDASTGMVSKEPKWFQVERGLIEHNYSVELFNLTVDPQQINNIAEVNSEKVNDLRNQLYNIMNKDIEARKGNKK